MLSATLPCSWCTFVLQMLNHLSNLLFCRFPASANPAVFAAQQTMVEAWTIVGEVFVDARFAGHNWDHELTEGLNAAYTAESGESAFREISHMLAKLGDPFTRVVPARCALLASPLTSLTVGQSRQQLSTPLLLVAANACD